MPVPLNEFHDRCVIAISVADMASPCKGRNNDQRDTRSIAEEIYGLHKAGIKISSTFVKGDDEGRFFCQFGMPFETINERGP